MPRSASDRIAYRFFLLLLTSATLLLALVMRPIAGALFLAAVLAGILWKLHTRLAARLWDKRGLSAGIFVFAVVVVLVAPVAAFSAFAIKEGGQGLEYVTEITRGRHVGELIDKLPGPLGRVAHHLQARLVTNGNEPDLLKKVQSQFGSVGGKAAVAVSATLSAAGSFLFQTAMTLIAFYFLLLQGDQLIDWIDELSPLKPGQTRLLLVEIKRVAYAVVLSTIITSAVQAGAALAGYWIAHVPHPLFFAGVTFFFAFIPAIGAGTICLLTALLVFVTGHSYAALFLTLWGLIVVSLIDNVVKPLLVKAGMQMNGAVVFFSLIGGLAAFGALGLLLGPLFVALFLALLRMYRREFRGGRSAPSEREQEGGSACVRETLTP